MMLLWTLIKSAVDAFKRSTLNWFCGDNVGSSSPRKRNLETWDEESVPSPKLRRTQSLPAMQRGGKVRNSTKDKGGFMNKKLSRSPKLKKKEEEERVNLKDSSSMKKSSEREQSRPSDSAHFLDSESDVEVLNVAQKSPRICPQPSVSTLTKIVLAKRSSSVDTGKGAIPRPSTPNKYLPVEEKEDKRRENAQLGEKMEYLRILQELGPLRRKEPNSVKLQSDNVLASSTGQSCITHTSLLDESKQKNSRKCAVFDCSWTAGVIAAERAKVQRSCLEEKLKRRSKRTESEEPPPLTLEQQLKQQLTIANDSVKGQEKSHHSAFTAEMEELVDEAFKSGPGLEVMVQNNGIVITRKDIHTLIDGNWLNDEVVNFYMILLEERGRDGKYPSVYCFNTFFYPKLSSSGHDSVKRWTSKVDVFNKELLIIPVHLGLHWCMACVDFPSKEVLYFDSMGVNNSKCLKHIVKYLQAESIDKKQQKFDMSGWNALNKKNIPQQMNGSDCGVFSCMYAEYLCRRAKITFSQSDMPFFRRKMACEILTKKLLQ